MCLKLLLVQVTIISHASVYQHKILTHECKCLVNYRIAQIYFERWKGVMKFDE